MSSVYHLDLTPEAIEGATHVLLPGDPGRVPKLAAAFDERAREIAWRREYRTFLGHVGETPLLVTSTGIGGPSTSIAVDELAQLGLRTFLRVGTTGAIQPTIEIGDVVITSGAVRLDGASPDYAPIEYPAVAHHEVVGALIGAARDLGIRPHVGVSVSSATFYPGEERPDSYSRYVLRRFRGATEEWRSLGVLNYEMEAATVLTLCSVMGLRGGCVTGAVNTAAGKVTTDGLARGEDAAIRVAVGTVKRLISSDTGPE